LKNDYRIAWERTRRSATLEVSALVVGAPVIVSDYICSVFRKGRVRWAGWLILESDEDKEEGTSPCVRDIQF
jgi:hypothetical protein